ncbi:MAG: dihydropteroate synthase [Thermoanaerobaculia bacterium]|nr:dihydropteroate synthase [Thermoanaerobaculia bacterium]
MHVESATHLHRLELPRGGELHLLAGAPKLLAVVNVTPDSFSDGGRFLSPDHAVEHALRLAEEGADALDLGAESTRPGGGVYGAGAREVDAAEELDRLLPVLERLRPLTSLPLSVDTRKAAVARAALAAGADLVNDVSALGDPEMAAVVVAARCPIVLMHSRGELASMQATIDFRDVVAEVCAELDARRERAVAAGIAGERILLDPGLGFGKSATQNLALLAATARIAALGAPVVVGASRKSFVGALTGAPVGDRLAGSLAAAAWAAAGGASLLRVHDVAATRQFLAVWRAVGEQGAEPAGR